MMSSPAVCRVSKCFIKPQHPTEEPNQICYLTPWDIAMLSIHYIQMGLLFQKPASLDKQQDFIDNLLNKLKHSLSLTLVHFYPLAGRLVTQKTQDPPSYAVFVDCSSKGPGAGFIYATLDMTIFDILSPVDVPPIVQSLFAHNRVINHDGHIMPLLSIQVTELLDGVFIGCSMNHSIGDGTSYWNFFNAWSEIFQAQTQGHDIPISHQHIHNRWFPEGCDSLINLPFKHHDEFISRYEVPKLREKIFHFSAESIAKLKARANKESDTTKISSFQSLSAHVWRCITRARGLPRGQVTSCVLAINNRTRMEPRVAQEHFGNLIQVVSAKTTAGELLRHDLGWAAWKVHFAVVKHNDRVVRQFFYEWLQSPIIYQTGRHFDSYDVLFGNSPRFNVYGNEFGMGKAVAVRSGCMNKFDGKVLSYPSHEGGGSMDFEVCLLPNIMSSLESDKEFMSVVSVSNPLY